ncbi:MAG: AAA family ATPase [Burkholderiales bacterium]|nr:AAA family ATPase [Burkholderiales bacterium]
MAPEQQQLEAGIAALEGQRAALGDAVVDAALAGLKARLAALQAPESAQSLKQVSILFLDVVGSTALGQHLDPEEIAAVMEGVLARGTAIVEAHRGKVLQYAGDNLLAAFGAERAFEDDAERAVRCGLALLELGKALGEEVHAAHGHAGVDVRVGIHTGGVLLGGGVDEDGSIRGQAVNIAARMEQSAPAGALRISQDTYRSLRGGVFEVAPQEPLPVKGVETPVRSYLVLGARPGDFKAAARGIEGVETRMIGRDAELRALQDAFEALTRPGASLQCVVVVGEAGVGKSRLLHEFANWLEARTDRRNLFQARATPRMQGQPYGLLHDLFARRLQILDSDGMAVAQRKFEQGLMPLLLGDEGEAEAEAHIHLLGQLIGLDYGESRHVRGIRDEAREIRSRAFHAAVLALRRIHALAGRPVVFQLDDLHWADDGSLDFIDHVAQVDRDVPILLLALTRPTLFERRAEPLRMAGGTARRRIDLHPLDPTDSRRLAGELLQRLPQVPDDLQALLTGRADGNPFYMEELVKMLVDQGAIATSPERWSLDANRLQAIAVPPTLTGVLQARLDSLPAGERRGLQLASVVGLSFWDAALAHVDRAAPAQLPALEGRELVHAKEARGAAAEGLREYAFHHQILHQVTYDTVLKRVKREAHARTADWLAHHAGAVSRSLLGAAAAHYEQAGDSAQAAEYYARAAEHMAGMYVHDAALDHTARALRLLGDDDVELRWRLLANRERVLDLLGRREAQLADIAALEALAEAMPPGFEGDTRRAEVAWRRADHAHRIGDWETQEREARRTQALAERAGDVTLALRAIHRLAPALAFRGDPATGRALGEAALARAQALGLTREQSRLTNVLTVCTDMLGDRVASLKYSLLDLELGRAGGYRIYEAVGLSNVGMSYLGFGAFEAARRHLHEGLRLNQSLGNRQIEGNCFSILSELEWREGNRALALSHAQAAHAISVEVGSRLHQADSLWSLGNAELALDRWQAAADCFERSEALSRAMNLAPQVLNALDGRARVALARGDAAEAQRLAEQLLAEAHADPSTQQLDGTYEHLLRLTLHRAFAAGGDPRADVHLAEARAALLLEADRIDDAALRRSFLENIGENRAILSLWTQRPAPP